MSRIATVVMLITVVLAAAGCADRPSAAELTESIVRAAEADGSVELSAQEAQCIATELLGTGLSDTTLSGLAEDFDEPEVLAAESERVTPAVTDAARACIGNS